MSETFQDWSMQELKAWRGSLRGRLHRLGKQLEEVPDDAVMMTNNIDRQMRSIEHAIYRVETEIQYRIDEQTIG